MFLKKLWIKIDGEIFRKVLFKKGLNLITDKDIDVITKSGNSIGKTTCLRVIDYCLGSNGKDIWRDDEFKEMQNKKVYMFIRGHSVRCILETEVGGETLTIERILHSDYKRQVSWINGEKFTPKDFLVALGKHIFGLQVSKPDYRNLIRKFCRVDEDSMSKAVKYLSKNQTNATYENLGLTLFGLDDQELAERYFLAKKQRKKDLKKYNSISKEDEEGFLESELAALKLQIEDLERDINNFNLNPSYEQKLNELSGLKAQKNHISRDIGALNLRLDLNNETINSLQRKSASIDPEKIKELYDEAQTLFPDIHRTFEEALNFHNAMISKKIDFVSAANPLILEELREKEQLQRECQSKVTMTLKELEGTGALSDLQIMQDNLNKLYNQKGRFEESLDRLRKAFSSLKDADHLLLEIYSLVEQKLDGVKENIAHFNRYFSKFSSDLYGERFLLSMNTNQADIGFSIYNSEGNAGDGKKKGEIISYDLAYLMFLNESKRKGPRFILHDGVEVIHDNQMKTVFENARSIDGQFIVAILRDKIPEFDEKIEADIVLSLSNDDKFFQVEMIDKKREKSEASV